MTREEKYKAYHREYCRKYYRKNREEILQKQKSRRSIKTILGKNSCNKEEPEEFHYSYYCHRCEENFKSKLPPGEAICIMCGSSKIE